MDLLDQHCDVRSHQTSHTISYNNISVFQPLRQQAISFHCCCVRVRVDFECITLWMCVSCKWRRTWVTRVQSSSLPTSVTVWLPDLHHFSSAPIHDPPPLYHTTAHAESKHTHSFYTLLCIRRCCVQNISPEQPSDNCFSPLLLILKWEGWFIFSSRAEGHARSMKTRKKKTHSSAQQLV